MFLTIAFVLVGCGQDNTIKMPFSHEKLELEQYSEVEKELKDLGFTNISFIHLDYIRICQRSIWKVLWLVYILMMNESLQKETNLK